MLASSYPRRTCVLKYERVQLVACWRDATIGRQLAGELPDLVGLFAERRHESERETLEACSEDQGIGGGREGRRARTSIVLPECAAAAGCLLVDVANAAVIRSSIPVPDAARRWF